MLTAQGCVTCVATNTTPPPIPRCLCFLPITSDDWGATVFLNMVQPLDLPEGDDGACFEFQEGRAVYRVRVRDPTRLRVFTVMVQSTHMPDTSPEAQNWRHFALLLTGSPMVVDTAGGPPGAVVWGSRACPASVATGGPRDPRAVGGGVAGGGASASGVADGGAGGGAVDAAAGEALGRSSCATLEQRSALLSEAPAACSGAHGRVYDDTHVVHCLTVDYEIYEGPAPKMRGILRMGDWATVRKGLAFHKLDPNTQVHSMSTLLEGHQRADLIRKLGKLGLGLDTVLRMGSPAGIPVVPSVGRLVRLVFERELEVANSPHCIAALEALLRIHDSAHEPGAGPASVVTEGEAPMAA